MKWADDQESYLRRDWHYGWSCSVIAKRMTSAFGLTFTKGMVISKAHALCLPKRATSHAQISAMGGVAFREKMRRERASKRANGEPADPLNFLFPKKKAQKAKQLGIVLPALAPTKPMSGRQGSGLAFAINFRSRKRTKPRPEQRPHINGKASAPKPPTVAPEAAPAPNVEPIRLIDRGPYQCNWIIGDPKGPDTLCCGAAAPYNKWCEHHRKIGFYPDSRKSMLKYAGLFR